MLTSQKMRQLAPELDPLRLGTGWKPEDLSKPQIFIESTFGDSHPGSGHLDKLVEAAREGVAQAGGHILAVAHGVAQGRVGHGGDHGVRVRVPVPGDVYLFHRRLFSLSVRASQPAALPVRL